MPFALLEGPRCFVRQELLGSEAVYEIVEVAGDVVTAEVVHAPGLPRGKRVVLATSAALAMERSDQAEPVVAARRVPPPAGAHVRRPGVATR
jgi:hypothetical protein